MKPECIVGIDGSDVAVDALRWAVRNAPHLSIVAVGAWHVPVAMQALMAKRSWNVDRLGLSAEAAHSVDVAIERVSEDAGEPSGDIGRMVVEGHAASALVQAAEQSALLVVGRRGISDIRHLVLGSVSHHCATHARVPVVVVPPDFDRPPARHVVVGFDGSGNACAALRWALDFFSDDVGIDVIAAIDLSPWLDAESTLVRFPQEVHDEEQRIMGALLGVDPQERASCKFLLHGPKQALADAAGAADLVVLGARGHGAIGSAMLGSVSTWMLHHAICPVAVVPTER